jgi:hypothetical protein
MTATAPIFAVKSPPTRRMNQPPIPDARLYKKSYGEESRLRYLGRALAENRNGLIAAAMVTHTDGLCRACLRC